MTTTTLAKRHRVAQATEPRAPRLLIVSNRLPVTVKHDAGRLEVEPSAGGLATGMRGPHARGNGVWLGWTGLTAPLAPPLASELTAKLDGLKAQAVELSEADVRDYYEAYANGVLWPLFHHFLDTMPLEAPSDEAYRRINQRFADATAACYREGDLVWVHDYQLMLVPALLRERLPKARIGFFLHIPFPPQGLFRTLPAAQALLEGLLGADVVGFHTAEYARNFESSVLRTLGRASDAGNVDWQGRAVRVGVFPMGVDAEAFEALGSSADSERLARSFREGFDGQLLVGIDRLDYTKGIPRRLLAYERLLSDRPELHGRVRLVQVAVPSRASVGAYQDFRAQVDALIGRINGRFSTPSWVPVHYLYRALSTAEVSALYRAADVMLVTPIRDGMNLVAKEFVATRADEAGVLVLSELAGAASELAEAVRVNPYDVERTAAAVHRALVMTPDERRQRMQGLRRRVFAHDVHHWAASFLAQLDTSSTGARGPAALDAASLVQRAVAAPGLHLLLDYDGTLVPLAETPGLAVPDAELLELLAALALAPGVKVDVVSGRTKESLGEWLGALPVGLYAEHCLWRRPLGGHWAMRPAAIGTWHSHARALLDDWTERTPGSLIEEKTLGLAWHYRMTDPEFGLAQANELKVHLAAQLSNAPVEVLHGDRVVELRPHGVTKACATEALDPTALTLAFGDDRTDDDLFGALPPDCLSIAVGDRPLKALLRVADHLAVRELLEDICTGRARQGRGRGTPTV
ncbi:MAG: bifunctional alpha,alpha-trehalose-phosphate synthase (UDP-forming)/trehalose-phosphatase [Myxococcaceae bacterium]|nr:bifunctional alpha,alpha-trehalose-phosphate synthase (UDP-forming)/trehalose-phosphatase [Myxococcaceae bacterium]